MRTASDTEIPIPASVLIADKAWAQKGNSYWNRHNGSATLAPGATREHVEHWVLRKTTDDLRREKLANDFFAALPKIG